MCKVISRCCSCVIKGLHNNIINLLTTFILIPEISHGDESSHLDFNASAKSIFLKFGEYEDAAIVPIHSFHLEYLLSLK